MVPPAANPGARVIGKNASDRTVLTSASRNQTVTIKPKGSYNQQNYTLADVCSLGGRINRGEMKLHDLNKHPELNPAMIPYSTMARWATQDSRGNHKNSLPQSGGVKGGGTVLGESAERELCKTMVEDAVRNTAMELRRVVAKTGKLYDSLTDVSTLVKSFIVRMAKEGIYFIEKHRRRLGLQQEDVGNWDETGVDPCAFASALYMRLKHFGNEVVAPFEQSPHWTLIIGFVGVVQMELLAIMKGTDNLVPSPFHAQLLKGGDGVYLGQTATGWVNT
ncbi:hypothetical protein T492DRAFT_943444 [Pavlovales sp. CCMP2436]|nr:hypothetical protein T492DRAFT_943444 [Pavlovales sp. CCMP2436]